MLELAILRNQLANNIFSNKEKSLMQTIKEILNDNSQNPFRFLIANALKNCEEDIAKNDFQNATQEIQIVHNLPLEYKEINKWDEQHFYRIELCSYLEQIDNVVRIKKIIAELARLQTILSEEK